MFARWASHFQKFRRSEDGVAAAFIATMLFSLVGMAALAIDVGHAYANRQRMQSAADAAALSGAIAVTFTQNEVTNGRAASAESGWTNSVNGVTVDITRPSSSTVQAVVQQPMSTAFSALFGITTMTVGARAVASIPTTNYCMIALSQSATKAFDIAGNSTIGTPGCGMASNSTATGKNNGGANVQGNATVNGPLRSAGSISEPGNPDIYSAPPFPMENAPPVTDPYASNAWFTGLPTSITPPSPNPCKQKPIPTANLVNAGDVVVGDKTICGLNLNSGDTTLQGGVFKIFPTSGKNAVSISGSNTRLIVDKAIVYVAGSFSLSSGSIITKDSTIVVYDDVNISGIVQLSAPTTGPNSGFALVSPVAVNVKITGGSSSSLRGAIYLPQSDLSFNGSFDSSCAQVIAKTVSVSGTVKLAYDGTCGGQNVSSTGAVALTQ